MILTSEYRRLTAVFNKPARHRLINKHQYSFQVGKFIYIINFFPEYDPDDSSEARNYSVEFYLEDYKGSLREKNELYEKITGEELDDWGGEWFSGRPFSDWIREHTFDPTPVGKPFQVLSAVINLMENFSRENNVDCFKFSSLIGDHSRVRLYQKILERYISKGYKVSNSSNGYKITFRICNERD